MSDETKPREWWIEDIEANRTEPAEVAKQRYVLVIEKSAYDSAVVRAVTAESKLDEITHLQKEIEYIAKKLHEALNE